VKLLVPLALAALGIGMILVVAGVVVGGLFMPGVVVISVAFLALAVAAVAGLVRDERAED
jgi:hypothetical protein